VLARAVPPAMRFTFYKGKLTYNNKYGLPYIKSNKARSSSESGVGFSRSLMVMGIILRR
jgi:hypothetical protein